VSSPANGGEWRSEALGLLARLTDPSQRREAARALARHLGAADLIVFTRDPELDVLLPAPGFPQTLPQGRSWRAFLATCAEAGRHTGELPVPGGEGTAPALGIAARDGSVLILLGGAPHLDRVADVGLLLPLLAAAFREERAALTAAGQAHVAREAAAQASILAAALDTARRELQHALGEAEAARRQLGFLAEASAALTAALDYETIVQAVVRLAAPTLADFCFLDVVTDGETIQRVAWAHADPAQQERVARYVPPQQLGAHPAGRTLLGGQPHSWPR
jgi:hypothetical protein